MSSIRVVRCSALAAAQSSTVTKVATRNLQVSSRRGLHAERRLAQIQSGLRGRAGAQNPRRTLSTAAAVAVRADADTDSGPHRLEDAEKEDDSEGQDEGIPLPDNFGSLVLRDYQVECVQECLRVLASGQASRIGVSSPTGSGKTTMFSALLAALPNRGVKLGTSSKREARQVLVIVSSIALATQTARAIAKAYPDLHVELEQGTAFHSTGLADVTVATAQTLSRSPSRLDKFDPAHFKAVIVDEAHHAAAPSYISILSYFDPQIGVPVQKRMKEEGPNSSGIPIIGFSATFARHDGVALGKVFQRIVYHKDFLEMVNAKWLSPVRFTSVRTSLDLASVPTSAATHDFRTSALGELMNTRALNQVIVRTWLDRAGAASGPGSASTSASASASVSTSGASDSTKTEVAPPLKPPPKRRRTTLIFAVNVAHVIDLTQAFRDAGVDARYVHGGQRPAFREEVIRDFYEGKFPVLINCAVLTEGADIPPIDCLVLARPTRSRNVFMQMLGRGLRLSPATGKEDCLVLDVVGATERGVMCTPTLFGLDVADIIEDASIDELRQRGQERAAQEEDEKAAGAEEEGGSSPAREPRMPRRITYIDYESPEALQAAMLGPTTSFLRAGQLLGEGDESGTAREPYIPVERMSSNAWVDCGGGVFVLEIPPSEGYVKIRKTTDEEAELASADTPADEENGSAEHSEEANWVAHFYPRGLSAADLDGAPVSTSLARFRFHRTSAFLLRPRLILRAATLDAAIRGADTYVERSVLRGAMTRVGLCRRRAEWRTKLATGPQRELVRKRLGFAKAGGGGDAGSSSGAAGAGGRGSRRRAVSEGTPGTQTGLDGAGDEDLKGPAARSAPAGDPLAALTKGEASTILTRLHHGTKARWVSAARAHNRELRDEERLQKKAEVEAEKEGRKLARLAERERESERRRGVHVQVGAL